MARLVIIRPIHPLPGRQEEALKWLVDTEPVRRQAGQISQLVMRNIVDRRNLEFVQSWESREAYDRWRESAERSRLSSERQHYLTHDPTHLYEVIS